MYATATDVVCNSPGPFCVIVKLHSNWQRKIVKEIRKIGNLPSLLVRIGLVRHTLSSVSTADVEYLFMLYIERLYIITRMEKE